MAFPGGAAQRQRPGQLTSQGLCTPASPQVNPTPTVVPPPTTRRSRESGNPGQGRMRGASPVPLSSFPRKREPRAGADARGVPVPTLHDPSRRSPPPPLVVPAKAGTQGRGGCAARPRPHPSRPLSSFPAPPLSSFPRPFRRSRESGNPGQGRMRGASPAHPSRRSRESRYPEGRRAGRPPSPPPFRRSRESGNPGQGRTRGASPVSPHPPTHNDRGPPPHGGGPQVNPN